VLEADRGEPSSVDKSAFAMQRKGSRTAGVDDDGDVMAHMRRVPTASRSSGLVRRITMSVWRTTHSLRQQAMGCDSQYGVLPGKW
jgi:hypothetical protein